jgi:monoamine oxidase
MMNFTAGPAAQLLSGLGERAAIDFGIAALRGYFGSEVEQHFVSAKAMDWSLQPWFRGAYSYTPVGGGDARAILRKPIGPLHFAGEATGDHGHHATVHGAIESGERAIDELPVAGEP